MKKIMLTAIILLFILSLTAGCVQKKAFGMSIEDIRANINTNLAALGSDITVPEFETQYGTKSVNGGPQKEDKKNINYYSTIGDEISLAVSPPIYGSGSYVILDLVYPTDAASQEKDKILNDFIAVVSAVIMTVEPDADLDAILDNIKLDSEKESIITYNTDRYSYEGNVRSEDVVFSIHQR